MIEWFLSLDKAAQAAIASGVASSIVVGLIAVLGFWITFKTSTAAMQKSLQLSSKIKIAEFRVDWIEGFRKDVAALYKIQYEIAFIKKKKQSVRPPKEKERIRELYYASAELKTRLLLRLKVNSDDENEAELERLLKRAVRSDADEAQDQRQNIRNLTRLILRAEWRKAKTEIET
jgi:hypothetical protein